jgi:hypothetical protein
VIHLLFAFTMLALGGLFLFLRPGLKTLERLRRLHLEVLATGRPATGQILRMDPTGNVGGTKGLPVLELLLRVQGVRLFWNDAHLTSRRRGFGPGSASSGGFSSAYLEA